MCPSGMPKTMVLQLHQMTGSAIIFKSAGSNRLDRSTCVYVCLCAFSISNGNPQKVNIVAPDPWKQGFRVKRVERGKKRNEINKSVSFVALCQRKYSISGEKFYF
ncbi:hypothetical protein GWI33_009583 [Rhynchophorus ferrugineus]|uniref:Uncharacterized protein n=1 Tax=Rhynchophorus ferrugineus TaxID=354439 RepID=A0A834MG14_RHYFE|nr:hypothetical protein GWI33_009583 [Rhynchophorus ferrugineus]